MTLTPFARVAWSVAFTAAARSPRTPNATRSMATAVCAPAPGINAVIPSTMLASFWTAGRGLNCDGREEMSCAPLAVRAGCGVQVEVNDDAVQAVAEQAVVPARFRKLVDIGGDPPNFRCPATWRWSWGVRRGQGCLFFTRSFNAVEGQLSISRAPPNASSLQPQFFENPEGADKPEVLETARAAPRRRHSGEAVG